MGVAAGIALFVGGAVAVKGLTDMSNAEDDAHAAREEQAAAQRAQFAAEQRMADIKNQRERVDLVRKARVAAGTILNQGAITGTMISSGVAGGVSSVSSQANANLGIFNSLAVNQAEVIRQQAREGEALTSLGNAQGQMVMSQNLFNLGSTIFSSAGGFKTIFDAGKKTG